MADDMHCNKEAEIATLINEQKHTKDTLKRIENCVEQINIDVNNGINKTMIALGEAIKDNARDIDILLKDKKIRDYTKEQGFVEVIRDPTSSQRKEDNKKTLKNKFDNLNFKAQVGVVVAILTIMKFDVQSFLIGLFHTFMRACGFE